MLVPLDLLDESEDRYRQESIASKDAPTATLDEEFLDEAVIGDDFTKAIADAVAPAPTGGVTVEENLEKRKEMLATVGQEPVEFAFERAIGENDSLYSNFCELLIQAKRKVGRIVVKDGIASRGSATGFMVSERLLLTNWHVFRSQERVMQSEVEFFYELDVFGRPAPPTTFKLAPNDFFFSLKELDYCLVAVEPTDISGDVPLATIGYHYLDPTLGKLGEEKKEKMNIIHHPGGDYQQISIRDNTFDKLLDKTIWYRADTAQGSSGSPVFNDQWQVVALHHMGVPSRTADGKHYADKDGNPVLPVGNTIDETKIHWIANEGIRISVLLKDVFARFPENEFVLGLKKRREVGSELPVTAVAVLPGALMPSTMRPPSVSHESEENDMSSNDSGNVQISFPASLIESNATVSININRTSGVAQAAPADRAMLPSDVSEFDEALLEAKKVDLENAADYSNCRGYDENFLGTKIPLPRPKKVQFVAPLKSGGSILKYFYFSTIQHSVRKMPIISAINVDGNPTRRKDDSERIDVWLRDKRMDLDFQLGDKFYKKSGFDRGHMSRREDANYGTTAEAAKLRADMTCIYTNAVPQVAAINQAKKKGLWGRLENVILEKGVFKEKGKFTKISVFNGPIFKDDDRFFRGIQIPLEFWKVVVWFNENLQLRATGFKLSQAELVGDIDFEKLGFDDIEEFNEYEISLPALEQLTDIDFSALIPFDTFVSVNGNESAMIESNEALEALVDKSFVASGTQ